MYTSFKVSITVLTYRRYNTCRVSGLVQIAITPVIRQTGHVQEPYFLAQFVILVEQAWEIPSNQ